MKHVLSCSNISKQYVTNFFRSRKKIAVDDVSFQVNQGEVFGIVGPNGAGKSTTLKILMGFVRQNGGSTLVNQVHSHQSQSRLNIGYLPEHPVLYPNLSLTDHLRFACRVGGVKLKQAHRRIAEVVQAVGLSEAATTSIRNYSKGMLQRGGLAYALILEPDILILDEPMSGLDPLGRKLVIDIISENKNRGKTILFSSHILTDVERVCDRIAIMNMGRIIETITPEMLAQKAAVLPRQDGQTPLEIYFLHLITGATE